MVPVYYIGKRTLFDVMRTGVFWGALIMACFVCFAMLYWGWNSAQAGYGPGERHRHRQYNNSGPQQGSDRFNPDESDAGPNGPDRNSLEQSALSQVDPKTTIIWWTYAITIGFSNLLAIFIMMGVLSRDLENRRLDILLARPVSRGQIFFGKLIGGWASLVVFLALVVGWTYICMLWSGIGVEPKYVKAVGVGVISPLLISSMTLFMSIWMRGMLAGFLTLVMTIGASNPGTIVTYLLGHEILKLDLAVKIIFKLLPPLNVIGQVASSFLEKDLSLRFIREMFEQLLPSNSGLYTEMWQVGVYFGVVIILGWLSFFRRQFT